MPTQKDIVLQKLVRDIRAKRQPPQTQVEQPQAAAEPQLPSWASVEEPTQQIGRKPSFLAYREPLPPNVPVEEPSPPPKEPQYTREYKEWWEQPAKAGEDITRWIGTNVAKVPILPQFLQAAPVKAGLMGLQALDEYWAAGMVKIFSEPFGEKVLPDLPRIEGENALQYTRRQYQAMEAPMYVKGLLEILNPIDLVFFVGLAVKGIKWTTKGARVALKGVEAAGMDVLADVGTKLTQKELAEGFAKGVGGAIPGEPIGEVFGKIIPKAGKDIRIIPLADVVAGIPDTVQRRFWQRMQDVPGVNKVIEAVSGKQIWMRKLAKTPRDEAMNALIWKYTVEKQMSDFGSTYMTRAVKEIPRFNSPETLFKLTDDGIVGAVELTEAAAAKGFTSKYLDDVLSHLITDPQGNKLFKWLDPQAEKFALAYTDVVKQLTDMAEANGLKLPHRYDQWQEFFQYSPRIVEGKFEGAEFIKALHSNPLMELTFATAKEGVEAGYKYSNDVFGRLQLLRDTVSRRVADANFDKAIIDQFGVSKAEAWRYFADDATRKLYDDGLEKMTILKKLDSELNTLRGIKGLPIGRPIKSTTLDDLRQLGLGDIASKLEKAQAIKGVNAVKYIRKFGDSLRTRFGLEKVEYDTLLASIAAEGDVTPRQVAQLFSKYTGKQAEILRLTERLWGKQLKGDLAANLAQVRNRISTAISETRDFIKTERASFREIDDVVDGLKRKVGSELNIAEGIGEPLAAFRTHPGFGGQLFPKSVRDAIEPVFMDRGQKWLKLPQAVSALSRTATATLDASVMSLTLMPAFGRNPAIFPKVAKWALTTLRDPTLTAAELVRRESSILDFIAHGGSAGTSEWMEALPQIQKFFGGVGEKVAGEAGKRVGKGIVAETFGRAEALYSMTLMIAKDELWKANRASILGKVANGTVQQAVGERMLRDLAGAVDKMTGSGALEKWGIGVTQRQVESSFLFFAPRYTRNAMALVNDVLTGGIAGNEARAAIAGMAVTGMTLYHATCKMLNQEENYNPTSGKFMTIKVGNRHVGVGGIYTAMMRLLGDVSQAVADEGVGSLDIKEGRLSPLNLNRRDQPFYEFLYNRTAPFTGMVTGVIEQADFLGEPFESVGDWAEFAASKVTPISLQFMYQDRPYEPKRTEAQTAQVLAANLLGLREFPASAWELRDDARNATAQKYYNKTWDELDRAAQKKLELIDPVTANLSYEIDKIERRIGTEERKLYIRWRDEVDIAKESRDNMIQEASRIAELDKDYVKYRERVKEYDSNYAAQLMHVYANPEYVDVMANLSKTEYPETAQLQDMVYDVYTGVLFGNRPVSDFEKILKPLGKQIPSFGTMENELGEPNWDNIDAFKDWILRTFGEAYLEYCEQDRPLAGRKLPDLYLELREAKVTLKPYWRIKDKYIKMFGEPKNKYQESRLNRLVSRDRQIMRMRDKKVAEAYNKFYSQAK